MSEPNDVKKGMQVLTKDDTIVTVMDNQRGVTRLVECPLVYDPSQKEIGSMYVTEWKAFRKTADEEWETLDVSKYDKYLKSLHELGF